MVELVGAVADLAAKTEDHAELAGALLGLQALEAMGGGATHLAAVMEMYLPFCGIAISNAQLFAASRKEYDRSRALIHYPAFHLYMQALLEVVNDLFEEQTDLEKIVKKIMHRAQTLLKCERCSVLLLEDIESPEFASLFCSGLSVHPDRC
uniref:Dual 3',5'-cyclic-AMP and -GMP phosphodiesterase 11A n=1 Tax=Sphaerodactylus townsendi TaxID=933632 RepID=A0ACB8G1Q1_9SAUR